MLPVTTLFSGVFHRISSTFSSRSLAVSQNNYRGKRKKGKENKRKRKERPVVLTEHGIRRRVMGIALKKLLSRCVRKMRTRLGKFIKPCLWHRNERRRHGISSPWRSNNPIMYLEKKEKEKDLSSSLSLLLTPRKREREREREIGA